VVKSKVFSDKFTTAQQQARKDSTFREWFTSMASYIVSEALDDKDVFNLQDEIYSAMMNRDL